MTRILHEAWTLFCFYGQLQRRRPVVFLAPLLFALSIQVLLFFASGDLRGLRPVEYFVAQTWLSIFLSLQLSFIDAFKADREDQAFELLRLSLTSTEAWFVAKTAQTIILALAVGGATVFLATLMTPSEVEVKASLFWILPLGCIGLSSVGVLLASLTDHSDHRTFIFPLLYLPLTTPVLLACCQSSLAVLSGTQTIENLLGSWLGMLIIFDSIYFVVAAVLFAELLKPEASS